jgi:hypothetical protein
LSEQENPARNPQILEVKNVSLPPLVAPAEALTTDEIRS